MELPRFVVIGHDAIHQVGEVCANLKIGRHALLVADPTTMKIAGETALHSLQERKIRTEEYLIQDADWDAVLAAKEILTSKDVDYALGVGGGRSIDVAKLSAFQAGVPFVSVPTAASHDGVVSSQASIEKEGQKQSFHAQTPIAVIMDTGIIAESPFRLLAAGGGGINPNPTAANDRARRANLRDQHYRGDAA